MAFEYMGEIDPIDWPPGTEVYYGTNYPGDWPELEALNPTYLDAHEADSGCPPEAVAVLPPDLFFDFEGAVQGTVSEAADPEADYFLSPTRNNWDSGNKEWWKAPINVGAPVVPDIEIDPPAAQFTPTGYVLPEVTGAVWLVNDEETAAGTYSVQPVEETTVIVIEPTPADGYVFTSPAQPITKTFEPIPEVIEIEPPAALFTLDGYMLPDVPGAVWLVNDVETAAGTYSVLPVPEQLTITIVPTPAEGYSFTSEPVPITHTFEPIPDPGPDDPTGTKEGAAYIARLMKRAQLEDELEQLGTYYEQVRMFVMGYTRGRGFDVYGKPKPPLMAVICAGAARLAGNPEQVSMYQMDNITVRPAVFQGYTLAEQGVLHNYRRRQA